MERCTRVEEVLKSGERNLTLYGDTKKILIDDSNLYKLLIKVGNVSAISEYFSDYKLDDIKHFLEKNHINYIES